MERNQYLAVFLDLGVHRLVRRFCVRRFPRGTSRVAFAATQVLSLIRDYGASHVALEKGGDLSALLHQRGLQTIDLSLTEVKELVLPVAVRRTNGNLLAAVMSERPDLRRFGTAGQDGQLLSLGEPDRWRTVVLLASAFAIAAKRRRTSTN